MALSPKFSELHAQRTAIVDAHCHTFNASDLPILGFLNLVVLNADESAIGGLGLPLARLLAGLTRLAPTAADEHAALDRLLGRMSDVAPAVRASVLAESDEDGAGEVSEEQFLETLQADLEALGRSDDAASRQFAEQIEQAAESGFHEAAKASNVVPADMRELTRASKIWSFGGPLKRYLRWIHLLLRYRYKITRRLIGLYGGDEGSVDLFTPALVDYDSWLSDQPRTVLADQMALMEKNIRLHSGRVHPFFPFDPWREATAPGTEQGSLVPVQRAVLQHGFVGVKLYPPMGFSATGNAAHDFSQVTQDPSAAFGARLDEAMDRLFAWCVEEDVPVMTHCSDSQESKKGYGARAHPAFWSDVLQRYPELRVNLGHFGGASNLVHERNDWPRQVAELMNEPGLNVYADPSYLYEIADASFRTRYFDALASVFERYPNAQNRLMYGSDWLMLAKRKDFAEYFENFSEGYIDRFGDQSARRFLGENALRYLGLGPGGGNRERLERFYERWSLDEPAWLNRVRGVG